MKREYVCIVRLSNDEKDMLSNRCSELGMNKSQFIRRIISNRPIDEPSIQEELNKLNYEVHKQGVNINQVVKKINEGFASPEAVEDLLCMQSYLIKAFREVILYCHNKDGKTHTRRNKQQIVPFEKRD